MKIQVGDQVKVCKGAAKGSAGAVLRIFPDSGRVVVEGVNIRTLHKKPVAGVTSGSIEKKEMPIDCSNVMLLDPSDKQVTRIGYVGSGKKKNRVAVRSGTVMKRSKKKKEKEVKGSQENKIQETDVEQSDKKEVDEKKKKDT